MSTFNEPSVVDDEDNINVHRFIMSTFNEPSVVDDEDAVGARSPGFEHNLVQTWSVGVFLHLNTGRGH